MSAGGFPETPKGSPGGIRGRRGAAAAGRGGLEQSAQSLGKTAGGLSGVSWSGPAESRFTSAAGGMSGVANGAEAALRTCARAARRYAQALEAAQKTIDQERTEYEDAQREQAAAGNMVRLLTREMYMAEPDQQSGFGDSISNAQNDMAAAGDRADDALRRARKARDEFDEAQQDAIGQLEGTAPGSIPGFGPAPSPVTTPGMPYHGPGAPFATPGTGGLGAQGGGFGVPPGGLDPFTGGVSKDRLGDLDPFANNRWDDLHGQTEVDDMTIAITSLAGGAGPIKTLLTKGGSAVRNWLVSGAARREAARKAMTPLERQAAQAEARGLGIEKAGELAGFMGVPAAGEAGKFAALMSNPFYRRMVMTYGRAVRQKIAESTSPHLARLRVSVELQRGMYRDLPQESVEQMLKNPTRPPIVR